MTKNIFIILVILSFVGCSQKVEKKTPAKQEKIEIKIVEKATVPKDFIPEHLKHAKIEVVKHY